MDDVLGIVIRTNSIEIHRDEMHESIDDEKYGVVINLFRKDFFKFNSVTSQFCIVEKMLQ